MRTSKLYLDPNLARFYDLENRARPDFEFCITLVNAVSMANAPLKILDLGCGTGQLAIALSAFHAVTAIDPAAAMLSLARAKTGADRVHWVQGDARSMRLGEQFDYVFLTGHAFQVFLSDQDQADVLTTIATHLAPNGTFVFDSRNPEFPGQKTRTKSQTLHSIDHPELGEVQVWNASNYDETTGILSYTNSFKPIGETKVQSGIERIRYTSKAALQAQIKQAGLATHRWLGDWSGGDFCATAPELIAIGGLV